MGEETSPLVHWLQITGRYEVVIQAGYVAPSIGSVFFRTHAQFPPNETVNYFADRSLEGKGDVAGSRGRRIREYYGESGWINLEQGERNLSKFYRPHRRLFRRFYIFHAP